MIFRKIATVLAIVALIEIIGILLTPDYDAELKEAKATLQQAEAENRWLTKMLEAQK